MNEIQLLTDIWKFSQERNCDATIREFRPVLLENYRFNRYIQDSLSGDADEPLEKLRSEIIQIFKIPLYKFTSPSRKTDLVYPRHIFSKVALELRLASCTRIGYFVRRDHTTVLDARMVANNMILTGYPKFIKYWHKFLDEANPYYTSFYTVLVKVEVQRKLVEKYSNTTPYGIAWQ